MLIFNHFNFTRNNIAHFVCVCILAEQRCSSKHHTHADIAFRLLSHTPTVTTNDEKCPAACFTRTRTRNQSQHVAAHKHTAAAAAAAQSIY